MGSARRAGTIRVVAVPAGHPYVRAVTADRGVTVLPDPPVLGAPAGQWWPPAALDASWIEQHAADADLLHVHFGTESFTLDHLRSALDAARQAGWPVVVTVHDIDHPQLRDQSHYVAQLGILLERADAVVTLTPGAAAEVRRRWHREAQVVPHPRILAPGWSDGAGVAPHTPRVAAHLKDLRPGIDAPSTIAALTAASRHLRADGIEVEIEVHLRDRTRDAALAARVRELCTAGGLTLVEQGRLTDDELAAHLARLGACVLAYGHGTHSGWLELCWDLGVPVVAPAVGHLRDQHRDGSVLPVVPLDQPGAGADVAQALAIALTQPAAGTRDRRALVGRRAEARVVTDRVATEAHRALYQRLIEAGR
ncbi:glycosyltransferase [Cellulomonas rhizosphaerae]|uniref:glycosyltransferase n=1 Tax=Cellulomonas rhizosphaerae TaxID=2293719 RepID=UPI001F1802A5|nr:glycosyltransferase [Cellulomonas rhizosphaerae]